MAFVIPIAAAFSAISAAGGVIAAMSTLTGFLTVAGGMLAGVGALTGKKDLVKLGSLMSLGGAIGNAVSQGAAEAVSATGAGADVDALTQAASEAGGSAASTAAGALPGIQEIPGIPAAAEATQGLSSVPTAPGQLSLADQAAASVPNAPGTMAQQYAVDPVSAGAPDALAEAGQGLTSNDITSWLDKAKKAASNTGDFLNKNKELTKIGGDVLTGMYGPEAEAAELQRQQMEQQQAWAERARSNLNSPIAMRYQIKGTT